MLLGLIITLAILSGQLIKLPVGLGGVSLLDAAIISLNIFGLYKIKLHLKKPPQFIIAALAFIIIALISLLFTPLNLQPSEYLISFLYIVRFAFYILFAWLVYLRAFGNLQKQIFHVLVFSGAGLSILGLLQFIFFPNLGFLTLNGWDPHYFRTVSTFLDPNFAGAFFVLTLILIIYTKGGNIFPSKLFNSFFAITFLALLTTFSRSSYIMFLVSGLTLSFFKKTTKMAFIIILLFLVLLLGFKIYTQLISKPRNIDRGQSASFRLNTWQQGGQLFQNHPILGVGFNAYRYALREYKLADSQFLKSHGASSNDSSLLFVAATTGAIGLAFYLYFLYTIFLNISENQLITKAVVSGLLIHSIFANSLFFPPILLWILLISSNPKK